MIEDAVPVGSPRYIDPNKKNIWGAAFAIGIVAAAVLYGGAWYYDKFEKPVPAIQEVNEYTCPVDHTKLTPIAITNSNENPPRPLVINVCERRHVVYTLVRAATQ